MDARRWLRVLYARLDAKQKYMCARQVLAGDLHRGGSRTVLQTHRIDSSDSRCPVAGIVVRARELPTRSHEKWGMDSALPCSRSKN